LETESAGLTMAHGFNSLLAHDLQGVMILGASV
jgi:hypothetical protein